MPDQQDAAAALQTQQRPDDPLRRSAQSEFRDFPQAVWLFEDFRHDVRCLARACQRTCPDGVEIKFQPAHGLGGRPRVGTAFRRQCPFGIRARAIGPHVVGNGVAHQVQFHRKSPRLREKAALAGRSARQ